MILKKHHFLRKSTSHRVWSFILMGASLAACGGDGDSSAIQGRGVQPTNRTATPGSQPAMPPETLPVSMLNADAGPDQTLNLPQTRVRLLGTVTGAQAQWAQISGPMQAVFESSTSAQTGLMLDQPGRYVFRLTAQDVKGAASHSDVEVVVVPSAVALSATSTPLDHIRALRPPAFKAGHTLLPLSQSSCGVAPAVQIELVRHWGYSAQFSSAVASDGELAQEVKAHPGKYPIEVTYPGIHTYYSSHNAGTAGYPKLPDALWLRDAQGAFVIENGGRVVSPAAPEAALTAIGEDVGRTGARVETDLNQRITLVTNPGESGLWLFAERDPGALYGQDPAVVADFNASGLGDWHLYNGQRKMRHERLIKEAILKQLKKGRPVYSLYQEAYGTERGRWWGWKPYIFAWESFVGADGKTLVSDYSAPEMYYNFHNSGWSGAHGGSMVAWDALTQALKNVGGTVNLGQRNIYPWVSQGWDGGDSGGISDNDMFLGMMKSYYTAGALGAVSGYFTCEGVPFRSMRLNEPIGAAVPTQIKNFYLLGEVHALFSHLEEFLREGELLPGPNVHPYRDTTEPTPAMEFPAKGETQEVDGSFGKVSVPTARVLARKIKNQDRWLISAWANTGNDREVKVDIDPRLGELTLKARRAGSVYTAELKNGKVNLRLIDVDGMNPTRTLFP
jgi:hypothetical protein